MGKIQKKVSSAPELIIAAYIEMEGIETARQFPCAQPWNSVCSITLTDFQLFPIPVNAHSSPQIPFNEQCLLEIALNFKIVIDEN